MSDKPLTATELAINNDPRTMLSERLTKERDQAVKEREELIQFAMRVISFNNLTRPHECSETLHMLADSAEAILKRSGRL